MLERESGTTAHRILVVDGEPGVADDYRGVLCRQPGRSPGGSPGGSVVPLEAELFAAGSGHADFPDMAVEVCRGAPEAIDTLCHAIEQGEPFSVAFVDPNSLGPNTLGCVDGLEVLDQIRALDPDLQIVIVTTRSEVHPVELSRRLPPAHSLYFMNKPIHAAEIQHQALALTAKWQSERLKAGSRSPAAQRAPGDRDDAAAMIEDMPAGLMVFDRQDRLLTANAAMARLFPELSEVLRLGTRYEDILLRVARRLLPEDTLFRVEHWVRDRLEWHTAGGGVLEQRLRGSRWAMVAEARTGSGATYCQIFDISELKQREISRANSARMTQMAQAFGALCERLHAGVNDPRYRDSGGKVVSLRPGAGDVPDGGDLAGLVAKLQAVAQRQTLTPEPLDPDREVAWARREVAELVPSSVAVEVVGSAGLWTVLADRDQLRLVLRELIMNACEALEDGGRIALETANLRLDRNFVARRPGLTAGEYARITVRDDGPGMSPELEERAFNPFFTSKSGFTSKPGFTSKSGRRHLGLGLSVAHGFVNQSGGHIAFREGDGTGTTIDIYLPRTRKMAAPSEDRNEAISQSSD